MLKINDFIALKDENLVYKKGTYTVPNKLEKGEYYLWGRKLCFELITEENNIYFDDEKESYINIESKGTLNLDSGYMTSIDNIVYLQNFEDKLKPNHIYRVGKEIPIGTYFFAYSNVGSSVRTLHCNKNECEIEMHKDLFESHFTISHDVYGDTVFDSAIKYVIVKNGYALYQHNNHFDEIELLQNANAESGYFYVNGLNIYNNPLIDMRLFYRSNKNNWFYGEAIIKIESHEFYSVNKEYKWRAKAFSNYFETLFNISISFENKNKNKIVLSSNDMDNQFVIKKVYDKNLNKFFYIFSCSLPSCFFGQQLKVTLVEYNSIKVNEELIEDEKKREFEQKTYSDRLEDFDNFTNVLEKIGLLDIEQEIQEMRKTPNLIRLIMPTLNNIANAKDNINHSIEYGEISFVEKAVYNKAFYSIAKIADQAKKIIFKECNYDLEYVITFDKAQVECIKLSYFILSHATMEYENDAAQEFLVSNCVEYYILNEIARSMRTLNDEYGYSGLYGDFIYGRLTKIIEGKMRLEADKAYANIVKEGRVPTKWKNEYSLFRLINYYNSNAEYQCHFDWLGQQSLDIYLPDCKIGIEYQGEQHYKPVDAFGGNARFADNQERDFRKKQLCVNNGINLLEWSYDKKVNGLSVVDFMLDNNIPFVRTDNELKMNIEMAPCVEKNIEAPNKPKKEIAFIPKYLYAQYDFNGNLVAVYKTVSEACKGANISQTSLNKVFSGKRNSSGGYIWKKCELTADVPKHINVDFDLSKVNSGKGRQVAQVDENGNIKQKFESIADASRKTGISLKHIERELKKGNSTEWMYDD